MCFCLLVLLTMFCCFCICILCLDFLMVTVSSQDNHSQLVLVSFSSLAVHVANWVQLWRSSLCTLYAEMCFTFSFTTPTPQMGFRHSLVTVLVFKPLVLKLFCWSRVTCTYASYVCVGVYCVTIRKKKMGEKDPNSRTYVLNI